MRRSTAALAVALCLPAAAEAAPRWTFCIAASGGGSDAWISEVFMAEAPRERLEGAFRSAIGRLGVSRADVQCPEPQDDRTEAVNAQTDAEAFNREMGARLHAVPPADFPTGRREASHAFPSHARRDGSKPRDEEPIGSSGKSRQAAQ